MLEQELQRRLIVDNLEQWKAVASRNYYSETKLSVQTVENCIILPTKKIPGSNDAYKGGVVTQDFKFVAGYERTSSKTATSLYEFKSAYRVEKSEIVYSDESVIFCGAIFGHFGHVMTEAFCRFWYVLQHPENHDRLVFLHVGPHKIEDWLYQFFDLMDIQKDRILILDKPMQFRSITIPDQAARINIEYCREYSIPYDTMIKKVESMNIQPRSKRIFLTRTKGKSTYVTILNIEYFERFFESQGYEIIEPEKLSLAEQISLVYNADKIATFYGTLSHFAVFCKPETKFEMLLRCDGDVRSLQSMLNDFRKIDWYFVDVSKNVMFDWHGIGVHLLGNTPYWQKYVREHFKIERVPADEVTSGLVKEYFDLYFEKHGIAKKGVVSRSICSLYNQNRILQKQLEVNRPVLGYEAHVSVQGTLPIAVEDDIAGCLDKDYSIEAVKIYFSEPIHDLFYAVCYENGEWTDEVKSPNFAGSIGKHRGICGIKIRLDDQGSKRFDIRYRIHDFEGNWSDWVENGSEVRFEKPVINAIQIELADKIQTSYDEDFLDLTEIFSYR